MCACVRVCVWERERQREILWQNEIEKITTFPIFPNGEMCKPNRGLWKINKNKKQNSNIIFNTVSNESEWVNEFIILSYKMLLFKNDFYCMVCMILRGFLLFSCLFCSVSDGKSCFSVRKSISTSKRHAEHPFASRNIQQTCVFEKISSSGTNKKLMLYWWSCVFKK